MVETIEGWEVATSDIPGAFLQTNYEKGDIHIKLEEAMIILLEDIDPEYYKYFIYTDEHRRECMYAEAKKAIYETLEASLQSPNDRLPTFPLTQSPTPYIC